MDNQPTLRDDLALERTVLANERTLLAYVRTAIAFLLTGASAMHLPGLHPNPMFGEMSYYVLGWALIGVGLATGGIGYWRYLRVKAQIRATSANGFGGPAS